MQDNEDIDVTQLVKKSPILARLIEEVTQDKASGNPHAYNQMHNRHNRSIPRPYPPRPPSEQPEPPPESDHPQT